MRPILRTKASYNHNSHLLFVVNHIDQLLDFEVSREEADYFARKLKHDSPLAILTRPKQLLLVKHIDPIQSHYPTEVEKWRVSGLTLWERLKDEKATQITIFDIANQPGLTLALIEGLLFSSYSFTKYKSKEDDYLTQALTIEVVSPDIDQFMLNEMNYLYQAVSLTRDMVNETPAYMNAQCLADEALRLAHENGFSASVLHKTEIEELKMGGLIAVNKGSEIPPTFTILEWKPENATNEKPIVLVGKGIVYDTGGINLKTVPGSLEEMKSDMAGAAAVVGTMVALANNKVPVHVVGLIPATDNRPGYNAYVPGDVIITHKGLSVEVINTDAEGRLILADALSYASQYEPMLTIDMATLTGSAILAIGPYGIVAMGNADEKTCQQLTQSGQATGERLAWFPFWEEYDDLIKSDVADIKNTGGREAGAITAGKFLSRFTSYPWIHLDIAGPAYLSKTTGYRKPGATGIGVRLLYHFIKSMSKVDQTCK